MKFTRLLVIAGLVAVFGSCGKKSRHDERGKTLTPTSGDAAGALQAHCGLEDYTTVGEEGALATASCTEMTTNSQALYDEAKANCEQTDGFGFHFFSGPCPITNRAPGYCTYKFTGEKGSAAYVAYMFPPTAPSDDAQIDCTDVPDEGVSDAAWHSS